MTILPEELGVLLNQSANEAALARLSQQSKKLGFRAGEKIFATGDACENFVLIAKGTARVQLSTRSGREMILFRLTAGQACALTTSCLLTESSYYAEGIAETDLEIIAFPASVFQSTLKSDPDIFMPLLGSYAERIGELTSVIDRLMSRDLTAELSALLLDNVNSGGIVAFSHQKIADEIGSSREVISRKLKTMEKSGIVALARGHIVLKDPSRLLR
jgi:CRP/FNR family transcriptional regulator